MYLEVFQQEERLCLRFQRLSDRKRGRNKAFGSYKVTRKLFLVYLVVKLQHDRVCVA